MPWHPGSWQRTLDVMSAQPAESPQDRLRPDGLQLRGEDAVIIPLATLTRLEAIERHATPEEVAAAEAEEAEIAGVYAEYRQYVEGGRQGGSSQEEIDAALAATR